jgi:16S rRNA (uracil1498-N3)-methyltransferase
VTGISRHDTEPRLNLILDQGLLKGEKMELVIQKTSELGIMEIIPAVTERSQVRETRKIARWRKIAEDASRQCGRTTIPIVHEPVSFPSLFSEASAYNPCFRRCRGLLFWEEGGMKMNDLRSRFGKCLSMIIAVGPEGGFTEAEAKLAESKGFLIASLGNRILRAETAAISATTIVQFLFGDLG